MVTDGFRVHRSMPAAIARLGERPPMPVRRVESRGEHAAERGVRASPWVTMVDGG